jgi:hypothetical protein
LKIEEGFVEHAPESKIMPESWVHRLAKSLISIVAGGLVAGLGVLFQDQIHAYLSYLLVKGNLRGEYVLQSLEFDESVNRWIPFNTKVDLKHGGTTVFGTESSTKNTWSMFGYFRDPVLSLAYENDDSGAVGTGTYTLTRDWPFVLWGHWIGVECNGNTHKKFLAQCPAVLYRIGHDGDAKQYSDFLKRDCISITLDSGPCPVRKTTDAQSPKKLQR